MTTHWGDTAKTREGKRWPSLAIAEPTSEVERWLRVKAEVPVICATGSINAKAGFSGGNHSRYGSLAHDLFRDSCRQAVYAARRRTGLLDRRGVPAPLQHGFDRHHAAPLPRTSAHLPDRHPPSRRRPLGRGSWQKSIAAEAKRCGTIIRRRLLARARLCRALSSALAQDRRPLAGREASRGRHLHDGRRRRPSNGPV